MERQSKSTQRIAGLVALSALTFGVLPALPADAATLADHAHTAPTLPGPGADATGWGAAVQERDGKDPRLVMVAPTGGVTPVGEVSIGTLDVDYVSPDAGIVVTTVGDPETMTPFSIDVWNTHTHTRRHIPLPQLGDHDSNLLAFSANGFYIQRLRAPDDDPESRTTQIEFRDYTGKVLHTTAETDANSNTHGIAVSADGKRLMHFGEKTGYVRSTATGKIIEKFPAVWNPQQKDGCYLDGNYHANIATLVCIGDKTGDNGTFAVSFATGRRVYLEHTTDDSGAISVPGGIVLNDAHAKTGGWKYFPKKGSAQRLALTDSSDVVGSDRAALSVLAVEQKSKTKTSTEKRPIISYNVKTGARRTLAGSPSTGGGKYYIGLFVSRWQQ